MSVFCPDYAFHERYVLQHIVKHKFRVFNLLCMPYISKIHLTYTLHDLVDLDDLCSSNYFYFFMFFFGKRAFSLHYYTRFRLNVLYHFFSIQLRFSHKYAYLCFSFLVHDVFPFLNLKYLSISISDTFDICLTIMDTTIFAEKRTNSGFFGLKHDLSCKFYYSGVYNRDMALCFLKLIKVIY